MFLTYFFQFQNEGSTILIPGYRFKLGQRDDKEIKDQSQIRSDFLKATCDGSKHGREFSIPNKF